MEKANLSSIRKTKKGKLAGKIIFENGKSMPIPSQFVFSENMNNKECEIERVSGQPVKIVVDGKELKIKQKKKEASPQKNNYKNKTSSCDNPKNNRYSKQAYSSNIFTATAPYNFVPLNKKIVTQKRPKPFNEYTGNTGFINLDIEAKTPLFIGGLKSEFYKQSEKYRIPGSSLRGMIRTMVEVISWSKFNYYNNEYLYYRSFTDKAHSIRDEYKNNMTSLDNQDVTQYSMSSGLLYKNGLKYFIIPSDKKFEKIKKTEIDSNLKNNEVYRKNKLYACEYNEKNNKNCYLVVSGEMPNKKHDWLVHVDKSKTNKAIEIPEIDIWSYNNDKNRKSLNLVEKAKRNTVPCFYVKWQDLNGGKRISFGHTPLFRLSYKQSIGDHINQENIETDMVDIAESIFGNENDFMTRLFFEDAFLTEDSLNKVETIEKMPEILLGPKPTSFQLYLDQIGVINIEKLKHYNNTVDIRGYKLYWHKKPLNFRKNSFNPSIDTKIKPINTNAKFKGRIRFENLSNIELGAILFAIDLPEGYAHKIGMAKPLGFGSIRINSKLYVSDRENRYKNLFAEWDGLEEKVDKIGDLKLEFEKYILEKLKETKNSLWETERLKELAKMLDFVNKPNNNTSYMELKQFKNRNILPKPKDVIEE
jgi:CRISPR-associated protein (TIGR03986 family)